MAILDYFLVFAIVWLSVNDLLLHGNSHSYITIDTVYFDWQFSL